MTERQPASRVRQVDHRSLIWILAGVTILGPMSIDMYLPALPAMARALRASDSALQLTITAFLLGFGLGPLLLGPLSDSIGRRKVLIGCILIFVLMSLLCAQASSVDELIGYRVVQALSGGSATTIARTVVHDIHQGNAAAKVLSTLMMALSLALMVAPAIGGQLLLLFGWRSIFLTLGVIGLTSLIAVCAFLPETLPNDRRQPFRPSTALKGYAQIFTSPRSMGFTLAGAFAGGAMFAYLAATPFIYIDYFGLAPSLYGVFFAASMIGAISINWVNMRFVARFGYQRMLAAGSVALLVVGLILMIIVTTGFGGFWGVVIAVFTIVGIAHVMGTNGLTGTLELFRGRSGMASATFAACRFAAGMLATLLIGVLNDGTPLPLGIVVLFCAVAAAAATAVATLSGRAGNSSFG